MTLAKIGPRRVGRNIVAGEAAGPERRGVILQLGRGPILMLRVSEVRATTYVRTCVYIRMHRTLTDSN